MLRDGLALVLFVLLLGQAIVAAASPESSFLAGTNHGPTREILQVAGAVLMFGGIALLVAAQLNLGASWRIGIDVEAKPGLVTRGLYRFCRHPIYLALLVILAGYALLLPTLLSLALLLGTYVGNRLQISAEEAYLLHTYGTAYRNYAQRVGRFLPGIGKSR